MRRMFEFACSDYHITEKLIDESIRTVQCCSCDKEAHRIVSNPSIKLEGFTGAFPGAYDRWARVRAEKLKQERKQNAE